MDHNYIGIILMLLLTVAELWTMEEIKPNQLVPNSTHLTLMASRNYTLHMGNGFKNNRLNIKSGNNRNRKLVIINIPSKRDLTINDSVETTTYSNHYVIMPKPILSKNINESSSIIQFANDESISSIETPFITKPHSFDMIYTTEINPISKSNVNKSYEIKSLTSNRSARKISNGKTQLNRNNRKKLQNTSQIRRKKRKPYEKYDTFDENGSNFPFVGSNSEDHSEYDSPNYEYNLGDGSNDEHYPEEARDYESKGTSVDFHDPLRYHHEPLHLPSKSVNKRHQHEDNSKDDKMAIEKLHNMYYCNKYCHCCKKDKTPKMETHHAEESAPLERFVSAMKRFSLDPIRRRLYGRNFKDRIADSDSKNYVHDHSTHIISVDEKMEEDVDDEVFVFFNKDESEQEEPSGVTECKGVCGCCVNVKRRQLAAKMKEKKKEEQKKESVDGITGVIRQLLYREDDGDKPKGRSLSDGNNEYIEESSKISRIGYVQKRDGNIKYDMDHHSEEIHDEHEHAVEHDDHHHKFFDCSKCCEFCEPKRKRRRKQPFSAAGGLDLLDFLRGLLVDKPPLGDYYDDYAYSPSYTEGSTSVSLAGSSNYLYDYNYFYYVPGSAPASSSSSSCCTNTTVLGNVVVMGALGALATTGLSAMNVIFLIILPMLGIGFLLVAGFLGFQAATPIGFLPLFIIVPLMALVPLTMLGLTPLALTPAVLPLLGGAPAINTEVVSQPCTNCTGNRTVDYPIYRDELITNKLIDTTTTNTLDIDKSNDTSINLVDSNQVGRQFSLFSLPSSNLYWNFKSVLRSDHCLERAGCHLAVYTHALDVYNRFIFRILEKLSTSFSDSKFTSYKEAYQFGSSKTTSHDTCTASYYCTEYQKFIKNKKLLNYRNS